MLINLSKSNGLQTQYPLVLSSLNLLRFFVIYSKNVNDLCSISNRNNSRRLLIGLSSPCRTTCLRVKTLTPLKAELYFSLTGANCALSLLTFILSYKTRLYLIIYL